MPRPDERTAHLNTIRKRKMARSAHAYVRGNTALFYEWLESGRGKSIPDGPSIWICGDCHTGNLGPVADANGEIEIQIRDLDQTVIGNPALDLVRLSLSLATSIRGSDLPGVMTARMLEAVVDGYCAALDNPDTLPEAPRWILDAERAALRRRWRHLARERIKDATPSIPMGKRFWPVTREERQAIGKMFEQESVRALVCNIGKRDLNTTISVKDCAFWMKGCSSLGNLRYAVIVDTREKKNRSNYSLIDIKEAVAPIVPRKDGAAMPQDNAQRVLEGARHLSPNLGNRMMATSLLKRPVVLRELMPQDLKLELGVLEKSECSAIACYLAAVVGRSHARQLDAAQRRSWREVILSGGSKTLDAPGWLWTNVVDLIVSHEQGYLEHCRRYVVAA